MVKTLLKLTVIGTALVFILIAALAITLLGLPDVRVMKGCLTTELYHVHLCPTEKGYTPYSQISPYIVGAVIMSEDASFYYHQGVDLYEMKESLKTDWSEKKFARGASTITQQLAKNVFLSKSKNLIRKAEEIYLALQIEKHFSKLNIITLYLNVVEFGDKIYGVRGACEHYFHKAPSEVTPEEAAFLAFLLPNPKKYSQSFVKHQLTPFAHKTLRTILHKMLMGHKINEEEYALAVSRVPLFPWGPEVPASAEIDSLPDEISNPNQTAISPGTNDEDMPSDDDDFKFDFGDEPTH